MFPNYIPFLTFIACSVIDERAVHAGNTGSQIADPIRSEIGVSEFNWESNAVVHFEKNGIHFSSGCVTALFDDSNTPQITVIIPWATWQKIKENRYDVIATTVGDISILFTMAPLFEITDRVVGLSMTHTFGLKPIHLAVSIETSGVAAIWHNGNIVLKIFHCINSENCGIQTDETTYYFCATAAGENQKIDAGLGSPFLVRQFGQSRLAGIQSGYDSETGYNRYIVIDMSLNNQLGEDFNDDAALIGRV